MIEYTIEEKQLKEIYKEWFSKSFLVVYIIIGVLVALTLGLIVIGIIAVVRLQSGWNGFLSDGLISAVCCLGLVIYHQIWKKKFLNKKTKEFQAVMKENCIQYRLEKEDNHLKLSNLNDGATAVFDTANIQKIKITKNYLFVILKSQRSLYFPKRDDIIAMLNS